MSLRPAALAFLLLAGGCASTEATNDPVFRQGYDAGCSMATSNRAVREAMTAGQPDLYRRGFSAGFTACGGDRDIGK